MEIQSPCSGLQKVFRYPYLKEFGIKLYIALCLIFFFQINKYASMLRHSHDSFIIGYMQDKGELLHIWVSKWYLCDVKYYGFLKWKSKVLSDLQCFEGRKVKKNALIVPYILIYTERFEVKSNLDIFLNVLFLRLISSLIMIILHKNTLRRRSETLTWVLRFVWFLSIYLKYRHIHQINWNISSLARYRHFYSNVKGGSRGGGGGSRGSGPPLRDQKFIFY
jgi:hypothetical protein